MARMSIAWVIAALTLSTAACGASAGDVVESTAVTTTIDPAEGAFQRNAGTRTDASGAVVTDPPNSDTGDPVAGDAGGTVSTTTVDPSATVSVGTSVGGDAPTTSATQPAVTAPGPTSPGTGSGAVGRGVVQIGGVDYAFVADSCDVNDDGFEVFGYGAANDGARVEVGIVFESFDFDGDGVAESTFDLIVDPDPSAGGDRSKLPEFYISVEDTDLSGGGTVTVIVDGRQIAGSGPIEDLNGIAAPVGSTLPMTFEASCT